MTHTLFLQVSLLYMLVNLIVFLLYTHGKIAHKYIGPEDEYRSEGIKLSAAIFFISIFEAFYCREKHLVRCANYKNITIFKDYNNDLYAINGSIQSKYLYCDEIIGVISWNFTMKKLRRCIYILDNYDENHFIGLEADPKIINSNLPL